MNIISNIVSIFNGKLVWGTYRKYVDNHNLKTYPKKKRKYE